MNRLFVLLSVLCVSSVISTMSLAQSTGDYRSAMSGNWSAPATWETFNGTSWVAASVAPSFTDGIITVHNTHSVTVDTTTTADQIIVAAGGTVVVSVGDTLKVADGNDSVDCVVNGAVSNFGAIIPTGRLSFESGAKYVHVVPAGAGAVPTSTWRDGSTVEIDSAGNGGTTSPSNITSQSFYNFVWNSPRQGGNIGLNFPDGYVFRGNVTITNTGGPTRAWRFTNLSAGQTKNISVRGNVVVNGPNAMLTATGSTSDTAARAIINVDGDVNMQDGVLNLVGASNPYGEWRIKGNVNITGGQLTGGGAGGWRRILSFVGTNPQSFNKTGGSIAVPLTYRVANAAAVVSVNFPLSVNGILELNGGKFVTSSANLLTVQAAGTVKGGSDTSFVEGPLAIEVSTSAPVVKTFPIGKGAAYRPVELNLTMNASTATLWTAEVFNSAPPTRTLPPALRAVSSIRYYSVVKGSGAAITSGTVKLAYGRDDAVPHGDSVRIANDDGAGNWLNIGGSGTADTTGSITSNVVASFGESFALGYVAPNIVIVAPTVATAVIDTTTISTTTANGGGNITNDGGGAITARGVCWNTTGSPTIADSTTSDGNGTGVFTSTLTGLTAGTTYFVRAYATNSTATGYGNEVSFTTLAALVVPSVTTASVTNISGTSALGGGRVLAWGGTPVAERGVCWSTSHNPTTSDETTISGAGIGSFTSAIGGLAYGTPYYVRAYAINSTGTAYGDEVTFTTPAAQPDSFRVVAQDGSGNYPTVQAALNAVPANYTGKWVIYIKKGSYNERLLLPSNKPNVILAGENRDSTIIWFDIYAGGGQRNPATQIDASDFTALNLTFQNPSHDIAQALAVETNGDRVAFYNCKVLGYQDTYLGNGIGRVYFNHCYVEGTVDFIYGRSIMVFDSCTINQRRDGGYLTAASTEPAMKFGINFLDSKLTADSIGYNGTPITSFYLGRPWQAKPRVVFVRCEEPATVNPAGWLQWNVIPQLYAEYNCFGPGYRPAQRVAWCTPQLPDSEGVRYTVPNIFSKYSTSPAFAANWIPVKPVVVGPVSVDEGEMKSVPKEFKLENAYPNPFNPETTIKFSVMKAGPASLVVYNVLGQRVATLFNEAAESGQQYAMRFGGRDFASGVYFYRLQSGEQSDLKKLIILK
ncbi:MAG: T9SS type A sorting domain-containing protein [Ignavibacteriae bacterium]|nr:T9SS type A sorting domain-containing protein [Ignavibacteriota bacterium]